MPRTTTSAPELVLRAALATTSTASSMWPGGITSSGRAVWGATPDFLHARTTYARGGGYAARAGVADFSQRWPSRRASRRFLMVTKFKDFQSERFRDG